MTASLDSRSPLTVRLVNFVLGITPLFAFAKKRARKMMIERAESMGVMWREQAAQLQARDWQMEFDAVNNPQLEYPEYYVKPFHAYNEGNLGWSPATEVELAAYAVHARIWSDSGVNGDPLLRQSFHDVLKQAVVDPPHDMVDLGCGVGMSTFALQDTFPGSQITGADLSPYFLAVAQYRTALRQAGKGNGLQLQVCEPNQQSAPTWVHAAAESTGLPAASYDLVSSCLVFHELPQAVSVQIIQEAKRLLRPGGYLAIMDMNPRSAVFLKMPPYILTLLKSTEPYLDEYFRLDLCEAIVTAGFESPKVVCNTPRHRTIVAQLPSV
ncbi:class I SAM-dependent methyltransferase [filamentous cyanobacterium LEGE 11480]|uniref:Class I SAM-dependent methyltransferase n=1 Tax=Romeriopsis navalis LEGE 11480 TaxID=2777977 RepID=A0A928VQJ1_9CYAN|nr:class I SAM-dependent methyltransferase [Romeriopsis navalis]MBE9030760.1 class I SAM-dependent methyltransferase [Romeriopsis navalis LEGE 11480]